MNGTRKLIVAGAVALAMSMAASSARADDAAPDRQGASLGILIGYGSNSLFKFGLGVRGGYTLAQKIYIGGSFVYHFGETQTDVDVTASEHMFYFGPEGGYDFVIPGVPQILIRPYLGLGYASFHVSESGNVIGNGPVGVSGSSSGFALWPSVTGLYSFTPNFSGGLDVRVVVPTFGDSDAAFVLSLTGQYKF
jgi:hypothetical protein